MKTIIALITCAALTSGCASPGEIADHSKGTCAMLGYAETDPRYTECTERGFRGQTAAQQQTQAEIVRFFIFRALL
jgi:hypothetical protein